MLFICSLYEWLCSRQVALPVRDDLPLHQIPLAKLENIQQQGIKTKPSTFNGFGVTGTSVE